MNHSPSEGLPTPRRHLALATVFCAVALSVTSITSVSVALPAIAVDLGIEASASIAIVNLFQLTLVATLLPFAALGQRYGYRRIFQIGMILMGFASLACAVAPDLPTLILARIVQAGAGASIMAMNPALLRLSVPPSDLGKAIGLNATVVAVFTALGPSIAALVLSVGTWHWLFLLNLPWVLLALAIGRQTLPEPEPDAAQKFDGFAAALNIAMFVALFSGLRSLLAHPGFALALLALAALLLAWLIRHQRGHAAPMLPLDLLGLPVVRYAVAASVCAFAAQLAAMVALPFLLHREFGRGMAETGLLIMTWPAAVAVMAGVSARLLEHVDSARLCAVGAITLAAGLLALCAMPKDAGDGMLALALFACGIGFGCFQTPNNRSMIAATPRARSGSAGGMQATARLCGQTLGTTLAAAVFQYAPGMASRGSLLLAALIAGGAAMISMGRRKTTALTRSEST